ncbi:hypothetical protein QFW80_01890 [Luteimonas sp. M1R5S18]|uniref:Uncharacterized protein n=1 Tax=Luteimonas rhizosphaericola TaxID=3042024 RepID=A0ABT6JFD6_9GAMM|nr:hypothetical protein [Luteimonas rhizosphaericola]MDH5829272.1 hypothetical protein [Luteimonas rhizosphaericola]
MDLIIGLLTAAASTVSNAAPAVAEVEEAASDMRIAWIAGGASLAGALLGAVIPVVVAHLHNKRSREDERDFLAVQVSSALYTYASGCVDVAYDSGEDDERGRLCPVETAPTLDPLSLDVNWRTIPVNLLDRIFALPAAQRIVNERLRWEALNDFEYPVLHRQAEYGRLALKALRIAHDLRRSANLPPDPDGVINLVAKMEEHVPELEAKIAAIDRASRSRGIESDRGKEPEANNLH